jgi:AraC-like DNA-binding protein
MEKPAKLRGHLHYLIETGEDPDIILADTGVTFDVIDALTPLPTPVIADLFDVLAARTPDDFAIRSGRATRYQNMGILGFRLLNSGTVRELLETWNRYSIVIGYPLESRLIIKGDRWDLEFRPRYAMTPRALCFCMESTVAGSLASIYAMSGHDIKPLGYTFPFPAPENMARYDLISSTPITFNGDAGVVTGRRIDIDLRLIALDVEAKALCDDYCSQALARLTSDETVSERLHSIFASSPGRLPTAAEAAALLGLSLRTLQRQLMDIGSSYHELVRAFRQGQACRLLDGGMETKSIAYLLGFQDVGSFRRAFGSWTGHSPSQWRRAHVKDSHLSGPQTDFRPVRIPMRRTEPAHIH